MNQKLLTLIRCDRCEGDLTEMDSALRCPHCGRNVAMQNGIPLFTSPPDGMQPSQKLARGPEIGTAWRKANWRFLAEQVAALPPQAVILDVGAGRGDFADVLDGRNCLALDVYPYPEVDIVCDLTQTSPFREAVFDALVLMNVLEHVYDTQALLRALAGMLKPGGVLIVAVPFLVKLHQEPVDFVRYTHYTLQHLGSKHGLVLEQMEGFYDPMSLLGEGTGNLKNAILPRLGGPRHFAGRALLMGIDILSAALGRVVGPGRLLPPDKARSHAPTGYHVVYRKI